MPSIMRPLLRVLLRQNIKNLISKSDQPKPPTSRNYWPSRKTSSYPDTSASFICLEDVPSNDDSTKQGPQTTIRGLGSEDIQLQELEKSYAKTGILVEHNITWTWACLKLSRTLVCKFGEECTNATPFVGVVAAGAAIKKKQNISSSWRG